ncbi:FAD-linked oxidase-like, C-terminal [Pleurostoma richardsiae]|uniref:FAD-linked oxidase-like, C-terminal n=1 Tax=Pleurostoma richardsiae TaxID=41990 RepID=A0AA38RFT3_9PEZI|nr:FAD-linked oxidase-like, C-terminal [Pleurostoma richardsiae]
MEVVLHDGDLLCTGSGAMKDNKAFPLYKGGFGPGLDGLFYQSNLGVVTKLGIHITPAPEAYASVEVSVPREQDLEPLVGTLSDLMRHYIILNSPSIANIFRIALTCKVPDVHAKLADYMKSGSHVPYDVLETIREQQGWGFWKAYFSLYGSVQVLPTLQKTVRRAFSAIPGVQITFRDFPGIKGQAIKATDIKEEEVPHSGIPMLAPLGVVHSRGEGRCGHTDFSPIIPPSGRDLCAWYFTAKKRTIDANFDFFADFHVCPRYVVGIERVIYDFDEEEVVQALYRHLLHDASEQGYMVYRTHVKYMDDAAAKLDFNQSAFGRLTGLLKDTLDPNGVLPPGKSGVWNSAASTLASRLQHRL